MITRRFSFFTLFSPAAPDWFSEAGVSVFEEQPLMDAAPSITAIVIHAIHFFFMIKISLLQIIFIIGTLSSILGSCSMVKFEIENNLSFFLLYQMVTD